MYEEFKVKISQLEQEMAVYEINSCEWRECRAKLAEAQLCLAGKYLIAVDQSVSPIVIEEQTVELIRLAAVAGNEEAQAWLWEICIKTSIEQDPKKVIELLLPFAVAGNERAQDTLVKIWSSTDIKEGSEKIIELLQPLAVAGNERAQDILVKIWSSTSVKQDSEKIIELLQPFAVAGNKRAQNILAEIWSSTGIKQDSEKVIELLQPLAVVGNVWAQNALVNICLRDLKSVQSTGANIKFLVAPTEERFERCAVLDESDCGYTVFGIDRKAAHAKLIENLHLVRDLLKPVVEDCLFTRAFMDYLQIRGASKGVIHVYKDFQAAQERKDPKLNDYETKLKKCADDLNLLYIYVDYDVRDKRVEAGWSHPIVLQTLAHLQGIHLRLWELNVHGETIPHRQYPEYGSHYPGEPTDLLLINGNYFERLQKVILTLFNEHFRDLRDLGIWKGPQNIIELLQALAAAGNERALRQLGRMYEDGFCVDQNDAQALFWYRKAMRKREWFRNYFGGSLRLAIGEVVPKDIVIEIGRKIGTEIKILWSIRGSKVYAGYEETEDFILMLKKIKSNELVNFVVTSRGHVLSDELVESLVAFLENHEKLTCLKLSKCKIGFQGAKLIATFLEKNSVLTTIKFFACEIDIDGMMLIVKALESKKTLINLMLGFTPIDDADGVMTRLLKSNEKLQFLQFVGNYCRLYETPQFFSNVESFALAVKEHRSLQTFQHRCIFAHILGGPDVDEVARKFSYEYNADDVNALLAWHGLVYVPGYASWNDVDNEIVESLARNRDLALKKTIAYLILLHRENPRIPKDIIIMIAKWVCPVSKQVKFHDKFHSLYCIFFPAARKNVQLVKSSDDNVKGSRKGFFCCLQ